MLFSVAIFKKLVEIHAAGVSSKYFDEQNVVVEDGSYRIVDFAYAYDEDCEWKGEAEQHIGGFVSDIWNEVGCEGLAYWGEDLGLWDLKDQCTVRYQPFFQLWGSARLNSQHHLL